MGSERVGLTTGLAVAVFLVPLLFVVENFLAGLGLDGGFVILGLADLANLDFFAMGERNLLYPLEHFFLGLHLQDPEAADELLGPMWKPFL